MASSTGGKDERHVDEPHDRAIEQAAEETGDGAEQGSRARRPDDHHDHRDRQRVAGAVERARQHVAPERVGAEPDGRRSAAAGGRATISSGA